MNINRIMVSFAIFLTMALGMAGAQERPFIWANAADKARLQKLMSEHDWAAGRLDDMKRKMAPQLERHKAAPGDFLKKTVPEIPAGIHAHGRSLNLALEASVLYFMTGSDDYAQLAADILNVYVQHLGNEAHEIGISPDGPERDYWDVFPMTGIVYDFIHPFLTKDGVTVYDQAAGGRTPFDSAKARIMFGRVVEAGFDCWIEGSNHTIMEGAGILYNALAVEDKTKRDAYIKTFLEGSKPKTGLYWMRQQLMDNHGVWPESTGYSSLGNVTYALMDALDRAYPEVGIYKGCEKMLGGFSDRLMYHYPGNKETVCFGDAHRGAKGHPRIPAFVIRLIRRAGLEDTPEAKTLLRHIQAERDEYGENATVSHSSRGGNWVYNEFLTMDSLKGIEPKRIESQAVVLPYAGLVIQNNLNGADPKEHGMMYYTGGAEYVHSHCSGLDLEIFGAGYVMGGVGGMYAPRSAAIFNDYYRNYAGHNTVVVNESSRAGTDGFWGQQKIQYMDRTRMEAMEPKPYTPTVSKEFAFSSQRLDDTVNNATQQRVVAIVRTGDKSGYYLDLFRSRSNDENKCHDYIYHNMGERLVMKRADDASLPLAGVAGRYKSDPVTRYRVNPGEKTSILRFTSPDDGGGKYTDSLTLRFPGWHYFSEVTTSAPSPSSIYGTFFMDALKRYTHVAMPGGFAREYTACKAPAIYDATEPYAAAAREGVEDKIKAQVLSIRQPGEAWNRPFLVIFEPSASDQPTVRNVGNLMDGGKVVGAKVVSNVDGKVITDWIIAQDKADATYHHAEAGLGFQGRFAIARTVRRGDETELKLYIGDGQSLTFRDHKLETQGERKGVISSRL